jgi:hypothetical protein
VVGGPAGDMQFLPVSADFTRHFPHMSAVGARKHPQQGRLQAALAEGVAVGGDEGDGAGICSGYDLATSPDLLWSPPHVIELGVSRLRFGPELLFWGIMAISGLRLVVN